MARQAREISKTCMYHVMMRGINRQNIFEEEDDYNHFIQLLYQMVHPVDERGFPLPQRCFIFAYCLMSNHVHLLIKDGSESISEVIKRIGVSYAQYYNKKYLRIGHLFQDRYKSETVNDIGYFFTLLRYIHQNPVAAGITNDVGRYRWSSWGEYERTGSGVPSICSTKTVLKRIPLNELRELVFEPLPKSVMILDEDKFYGAKTDDEVKEVLVRTFGIEHPSDLQLFSRERQNVILHTAKECGASIRQLVRLTGISFTIVRNA